jgi:hypothetical protein
MRGYGCPVTLVAASPKASFALPEKIMAYLKGL